MSLSFDISTAPPQTAAALERLARSVLFLAAFLLFWVSVNPFHDLADPSRLTAGDHSVLLKQISISGFALLALMFAVLHGWRQFSAALTIPFIATLAALLLSAALSSQPDLSLKRLVLAVLVIVIALACIKLPGSVDSFARLLAAGALVVLVTCYAGVFLLPSLSVHHAGEVLEPEHAGYWRGLFVHKNQAAGGMVVLAFIGIFVGRMGHAIVGTLIAALSVLFLLQTGGKTATALLPIVIVLSFGIVHMRSPKLRIACVLVILAASNFVTVGSALLPSMNDLLSNVTDATFTNRTDIWRLASAHIAAKPLLGQGFQAFWGTASVMHSSYTAETWATIAGTAHNSYVDVALSAGMVGLVATIAWLVVQPARDVARAKASTNDPRVTMFFVNVWLFALLHGCLETITFEADNSIWFTLLIAVFGLRFHATQAVIR